MLSTNLEKIKLLRINTGETIVEMSEKLGLSTSYPRQQKMGKENSKRFAENVFKNYDVKEDRQKFKKL